MFRVRDRYNVEFQTIGKACIFMGEKLIALENEGYAFSQVIGLFAKPTMTVVMVRGGSYRTVAIEITQESDDGVPAA